MKIKQLNLLKSLEISILILFSKRYLDMISKDKDDKLIRIYFFVCEKFEELQFYCERFSNNKQPEFTDQEIMTIYLYAINHAGHTKVKHIYRFASDWLRSWFPKLGSYQAFNNRLNRLGGAFTRLTEIILNDNQPEDCCLNQSLMDSMPIITCSGKRIGKVARELTDKGYCSTKGMYYYGLKMHLLGFRRIGKLPHPEQILFTPASVNDVTVFKESWAEIEDRVFFGDKIYFVNDLNESMLKNRNSETLAPIKAIKGMHEVIKQRIKAADDLFSTAVSKVRQPIEAIFNWLIEKADIQKASKVRSTKGLIVHAFGKLAAAFINLAI
ncbi:transposase [Roseimarinus sediminis]|uniref:transposase n=1 Tax=Roseimarinus sediminis TaxID=1610899 RepID=UPI003D216EE1